MADPHDARSYKALGSTGVAFETETEGPIDSIDIGVGVIGKICGVHGETSDASLGTKVVPTGTGVHGRGERIGVHGAATSKTLVRSFATGVLGEGWERSNGIVGLSFLDKKPKEFDPRDPKPSPDDLGDRSGVIGASNANSLHGLEPKVLEELGFPAKPKDPLGAGVVVGAGVVGLSLEGMPLQPPEQPRLPDPSLVFPDTRTDEKPGKPKLSDGTGVWGLTKGGVGVYGESRNIEDPKDGKGPKDSIGAGVFGRSDRGRGGVFQSEAQSQLRLVPRDVTTTQRPQPGTPTLISTSYPLLPRDGHAGDLCVTRDERGDVRLWFCVRGVVDGGQQAGWASVELGETFDAQP